jgi:cell division protein FtsB
MILYDLMVFFLKNKLVSDKDLNHHFQNKEYKKEVDTLEKAEFIKRTESGYMVNPDAIEVLSQMIQSYEAYYQLPKSNSA